MVKSSIVISSGHGKYIRGAAGYLDEVDEARRVVEKVATVQLITNPALTPAGWTNWT